MITVMLQWISLWQKSRYLHSFSSPISLQNSVQRAKKPAQPISYPIMSPWPVLLGFSTSHITSPEICYWHKKDLSMRPMQSEILYSGEICRYIIIIHDMYIIYVSLGSIGSKSEPQPMWWVITWFHNQKLWWDGNETSIYVGYVNIHHFRFILILVRWCYPLVMSK